ncbi:(2Fe-2S)-binding protein [Pelagibius sp. Alg239-R121]|uniref:(2Fe-2S)-binding protein n=1 Tax=Pelagibius sp. Alg239-R121 TaxID=2993448 RepID=UPI0024A765AE|nr:(2Fe-2S)-binding protein [Pelagibius sp. Alg239-R121]
MRRIEAVDRSIVKIFFDGQLIEAYEGDSVAAALLSTGMKSIRDTAVTATPRGPFCMMGVCFDCLVEIDGLPNRQACMIQVYDGMVVERQSGAAAIASDSPSHNKQSTGKQSSGKT